MNPTWNPPVTGAAATPNVGSMVRESIVPNDHLAAENNRLLKLVEQQSAQIELLTGRDPCPCCGFLDAARRRRGTGE
jgi:hypothetical protein